MTNRLPDEPSFFDSAGSAGPQMLSALPFWQRREKGSGTRRLEIYGRVPRTEPADLVIAELEQLYANRWRGPVFFVDDNFVRFDSDTDGDQRYSRR